MVAAKIITTYPSTLMTGSVNRAKAFIDRIESGADYAPGSRRGSRESRSGTPRRHALDRPTRTRPGNYPGQPLTSLR